MFCEYFSPQHNKTFLKEKKEGSCFENTDNFDRNCDKYINANFTHSNFYTFFMSCTEHPREDNQDLH